ncbi:MAG: Crp/Fnr family transcriptional regulator [Armatimonadota bacterium]|nr:Crp/Fnr family transcriptional regulator [Armatimonadota bacterium]
MRGVRDSRDLLEIPLFHDLSPEHLDSLNNMLSQQVYPARKTLMLEETPGDKAFILLEGTVKIYVQDWEGREVILGFRGRGEVLGEMSLLDSMGHSANVVAQNKVTVLSISRKAFWECLQVMPPMIFNLARILSRRTRVATSQILSLATQDVQGRVARQLLTFADEYGQALNGGSILIPLRLTQSDLAGLVGATRVRVNEVLAGWKSDKWISVDEKFEFTILKQLKLAELCKDWRKLT